MAAGRKLNRFARRAVMVFLLAACACSRAENTATQVVDAFIEALHIRNQTMLDTLMAWDSVAIYQYYVSGEYYASLDENSRKGVLDKYRDLFFKDYFPEAAKVEYTAEAVYIARGTGNAIITAEFPPDQAENGKRREKQQFNLELSLFKDRNRWLIVDLNDFIQLNMLRGDYDPGKFYLPEPSR